METNDFIIENDILLSDQLFFGDNKEHPYNFKCYDGYAVGTALEDETPQIVEMTYPTLEEILANKEKTEKILKYRGLYDLYSNDLHYGDVMVTFGEIVK